MPAKTTFHERAHIELGHTSEAVQDSESLPRNLKEVEAESVAVVVPGAQDSDRGVQYARRDYVQLLRGRGLAVSMSAMAGLLFIASQPLGQMLGSTATWLTFVHWLSR